MGDNHDHYLKDVLLLADVFERLIDTCLKFYRLYHCHYFSSPGLSWDAMLKMTSAELEKLFDIDMYLFVEKGLIGEISYIVKRCSEANNKYMKHYDPTKPSKYIPYIDVNNLHGWAMSGYFHYGEFKWLKTVNNFDINSISEKRPAGYILEVDLEQPDELHVLHNDYSLAPEKLAIPYDMLSGYCKKLVDEQGIKVADVMKLIPNLGNKNKYIVYYKNLQLYLPLEMKLTKIHKVLKFQQSDWIKTILILILKKEQMLLIVWKKTFLN